MDHVGWRVAIVAFIGFGGMVGALAVAQVQPAQDSQTAHNGPNSLPSTNFSADRAVDFKIPRPAPGFANAHVASNPHNQTLVYSNKVYTDAGPQGYNTNLVGLFVNVKL